MKEDEKEGLLKLARSSTKHKAAQLLILLGIDEAARVINKLDPGEVETLARQISMLSRVDAADAKSVLEEFGRDFNAGNTPRIKGGVKVAREILSEAFGDEKAKEILEKSAPEFLDIPFAFLNRLTFDQLAGVLNDESPRSLALILSHINRVNAMKLIKTLPKSIQAEVIIRMAHARGVSPEVIATIENVLLEKVRILDNTDTPNVNDGEKVDGSAALAEMLRFMDRNDEQRLLEELEKSDPAIAVQIKQKLYTMDSILNMRERDLQHILMDFSDSDIAILLKNQSKKIKEKVLDCLSSRRRLVVVDEMELSEASKAEVNTVTTHFIETLKQGEDEGRFTIIRYSEEYL